MSPEVGTLPIVWIDVETTGLDPNRDYILELGMMVTDYNLHVLDAFTSLMRPEYLRDFDSLPVVMDPFVIDMHTKNGLLSDLEVTWQYLGTTLAVQETAIKWVYDQFPEIDYTDIRQRPLLGGHSVHFDKAFLFRWMPSLYHMFHYRNLDVSVFRTIAWLHQPEEAYNELYPKQEEIHRVTPDCKMAINDYARTLKNIKWRTENGG